MMKKSQNTGTFICHTVRDGGQEKLVCVPEQKSIKTEKNFTLPFIDTTVTVSDTVPPTVIPFQNIVMPNAVSSQNPTVEGRSCDPRRNCDSPPPGDTLISLDGENCISKNDEKYLPERRDLNKYLKAFNYCELCDWIDAPLTGYNGIVNPSALTYTLDPPLVIPPGQKGFNMVPPYPPTPIINLTGKNVLVVGASKNLGLAIATTLKGKGCNVVGTSRDPGCYDDTNFSFPLLRLDIRKSEDVKTFFKRLMHNQFSNGKIDVLINCPGIQWRGDLADANGDDLSDIMDFQVGGYQRVVFHALPFMKHSATTKVISFGSVAGEFPTFLSGYSIGKRALHVWNDIHMVEGMARKALGKSTYEPTFILVEPGIIQSTIGLYEHYYSAKTDPKSLDIRARFMLFTALQSAGTVAYPILASAPPCPTVPSLCNAVPQVVADAIYQIILAPQPSVRYLIDPLDPAFNFVNTVAAVNILSADDVIKNVSIPLASGLFYDPANAALGQGVLNAAFCE
jgi:NAD(P)-dependent dehydrogenase (short-subunit alcohol dehydrogenase family)